MAELRLKVNGKTETVEADPSTHLLWVLREKLGLTGPKYSCGIARCGACMVHVDGKTVPSCNTPVSEVMDGEITTIEGLSRDGEHPVQKAWIEEQVPQCGYCQSGQIMRAAELLATNPNPSREEIFEHMERVVCRCATYYRVVKAINRAAKEGGS
ncbi:MAG: (2Fe-2S)-binding protein [Acidobacteria bacterium]|nr:MAG: (2Fe-2S)-binding protein [Acidobacteriota bacterium]REK02455.1 MAG: (2Fe-2S)-binding protein [Acidobacteriota bacterium]REK13743.1 MAG: (2Fe-2S)-binding protein [Acidobacteriota bacterium]REK41737.1 MAG: (2Fe-2S)-binding protein [Acidobacteriota bacterium]